MRIIDIDFPPLGIASAQNRIRSLPSSSIPPAGISDRLTHSYEVLLDRLVPLVENSSCAYVDHFQQKIDEIPARGRYRAFVEIPHVAESTYPSATVTKRLVPESQKFVVRLEI